MTDVKKIIFKVISLGLLAAFISIMLVSMALARRDETIYPSNIAVGGISIGNLNQNEAKAKLKAEMASKWDDKLRLRVKKNDSLVSVPIAELGIEYNVDASLAKVNDFVSKPGSPLQHVVLRGDDINIAPALDIKDKSLLTNKLVEIKSKVDKPASNARVLYIKGYLEYLVHSNGYIVDLDASLKSVISSISKGSLGPVDLTVKDIYPKVKAEDIKSINSLIGVSMSELQDYQVKDQSLAQVISELNGTIVMSGDEFSFNETIKQPAMSQETAEQYQNSINKVSNTLINACQSANLTVTNHNSGQVKFANNLGNPIMLHLAIADNKLLVKIFGCQTEKGKEILLIKEQTVISPGIELKVDRKLKPGDKVINQEGQDGKKISTYRVVKVNGEEVEKKLLSEEIKPARDTIMTVAPGTSIK